MITFNDDPNFSIVTPGGCNAECDFCFASEDTPPIIPDLQDYLTHLSRTLSNLPKQFYQVSITGGEPLMSPYIIPILTTLFQFKKKYTNILLTTNGTNLDTYADLVALSVDHINISRHDFDENENKKIFGGTFNIMDKDIEKYIEIYSKRGIDISANCVIFDSTPRVFIEEYIKWAKYMGFQAIRFRKVNGTLDKTPVEMEYLDHKVLWNGSCPVCRTTLQMIHGMNVYWKSSTIEPSDTIKEIFELIFGPDGRVYKDWKYTIPISTPIVLSGKPEPVELDNCGVPIKKDPKKRSSDSSGGGGSGRSSCGRSSLGGC